MSSISSTTTATLASALLNLSTSAQPGSGQPAGADQGSSSEFDRLNLSGGSISSLEAQAREIASQNRNSVITTSEQALAANLAAVSALGSNFAAAASGQGSPNAGTVYSLTM